MNQPDRIAQLFEDNTVLITGVTGLIGKVLLWKILRVCSSIRKVYVFIRNQEDKEAHVRLNEIFINTPGFEEASIKVEVVCGDLLETLKLEDFEKIREDVSIIYHCAELKMGGLKDTVLTNVRGTKQMLDLARSCRNLKAFIHVSTTFCHFEEVLDDAISLHPQKVIEICEFLPWNVVEKIKKDILGPFPHCYHFAKALSENLVAQEMNNLPVVIVRPSVVVPTLKEPVPGYSRTSPSGFLVGVGTGLVRTLCCNQDTRLNCIPADILANFLLYSTYDFITNKERRVYNAVSGQEYTMRQVVDVGQTVLETFPFSNLYWYPRLSLTESKIKHYAVFICFQLMPALLLDALLILCRIKPHFMPVQSNAWNVYALCQFYTKENWCYDRLQSLEGTKQLNEVEKDIYKLEGIEDLREYLANCVRGAQNYTLGENSGTNAHLHMKLMWCVDKICVVLIVAGIFYYLSAFL